LEQNSLAGQIGGYTATKGNYCLEWGSTDIRVSVWELIKHQVNWDVCTWKWKVLRHS